MHLGMNHEGKPVGLLPSALRTHATIVGMTGSGKTGLVLGITEELVRNRVPVVCLDIKGDLANIFLQSDPAALALMKPRIITPGASHGEPVNITSGFNNPDRVSEAVTALLELMDVPSDPLKSKQHAFITAILLRRHKKRQRCQLVDLVMAVQEPPFLKIGVMDLDKVISPSIRQNLASKLNNILAAPSFKHWREGIALDVAELTAADPVRTPVIIYSVAHLTNDDERMFAISLLLEEMVAYMRKCDGTEDLRAAFIVDECFGLMSPRGNGPTKKALLTLLKQGRSVGLGMILATQNPMDLDYMGMANCGTWITGRLQTTNDRRRLVEGICNSVPGIEKKALTEQIGGLKARHFLMARDGQLDPFVSRNTGCELRGPMTMGDLKGLVPKPAVSVIGKLFRGAAYLVARNR